MITFSKLGRYGQLGNQMFQYAMLLGVASRRNFEVKIPYKFNGVKKHDQVELEPFGITARPFWMRDRRNIKNTFLYEDLKFNPDVFEQPDGTDYCGYYQSEKYFLHAEGQVRREFKFKDSICAYVKDTANYYRAGDDKRLVAVHVRRGDYLNHPDCFHVLTPDYYERAMNHYELDPKRCRYLVFSDDLDWCQENLRGQFHLARTPDHWHDMALMAQCDSHIIAGSSFSWWGAWLCTRPNQVVIAPSKWFPHDRINTEDVVPERWLKLEI